MRIILTFMSYSTVHINEITEFFKMNRDSAFSVDDIAKMLPDIPQSTIYRILGNLSSDGKIEKVYGKGRVVLYRYTDPINCPHHLHLHCQKCGKLMHLSEHESEKILQILEESSAFHALPSTTLEGICRDCKELKN